MKTRTEYRIVVPYGTRKDQTYYQTPDHDQALQLLAAAKRDGYTCKYYPARIEVVEVEVREREKRRTSADVGQAPGEDGGGGAVQEGTDSPRRPVRNLRGQPAEAQPTGAA
jgi:hypothetical protein